MDYEESRRREYVDGDPPDEGEGCQVGSVSLHDRHVRGLLKWMPPEHRFGPDPNAPEPEPVVEAGPVRSAWDPPRQKLKKPDPADLAGFEMAGYWRNVQRHVERDGIRTVAFLAAEGLLSEEEDPVDIIRDMIERDRYCRYLETLDLERGPK